MEPLQTWWTTELYPTSDEDNFGVVGNFEVVKAADAQATIAALQARVQELEGITKVICGHCCEPMEIPSRAVLQSQLTQHTAERDTARRRVDELEAREVDVVMLREDLEQRTAELEALRPLYDDMWKQFAESQAELERVRGELGETKLYLQQERANRDSLVACVNRDVKTIKELRTLILALPKVEGEITVSHGYVKDSTRCHALFGADEDAALYAALLKHRQGMEG